MRIILSRPLYLAAILVLALSTAAAAQPVTGEIVVSNAGGFFGNSVIGMGRYGTITTILPISAGNVGGATVNHVGNEDLIVVDRMILGINDGSVRTLTASLALPAQDIAVDEDNTWVMAAGSAVLGLNPLRGKKTTIATGFKNASAIIWYGTNGDLLVADSGDDKIYAIARDHTKRIVATVPNVRCMEWNSYSGNVFVAAKDVLYNLTPTGVLTTLSSGTPGLKAPTAMFLRSDRTLLVVQGNTNPTGLYAYFGSNGRYNRPYREDTSPSTGINPAGITVEHYRELWPIKTEIRVGQIVDFRVNFPQFKGKTFIAAMSFSHAPGFPVGNYRLHLNVDPLFLVSLTTPSLFKNNGVLSSHGTGRVTLAVPDIAGLAGLRIFLGAVVLDANAKEGIGEASNALGITIQAKE